MRWTFEVCSLSGVALGELTGARDRQVTKPLNGLRTVTFKLDLTSPHADLILTGDVLLKGYRHPSTGPRQLRHLGPLLTAEEVADDTQRAGVTVVSPGIEWRLQKRLVGKRVLGFSMDTTDYKRDQLIAELLRRVNVAQSTVEYDGGGDTGIRTGAMDSNSLTRITDWYFKPVLEGIGELSGPLDGVDYEVVPVEPVQDASGVKLAELNVADVLGSYRPEAIFEYGIGKKNIRTYRRQLSNEGLCNRGYSLPQGFPETSTAKVLVSVDTESVATRTLHEEVIPSDLVSDDLRARLVVENVALRKAPRNLITFEPIAQGDVPELGVDYDVGDFIPARAKVNGKTRFSGSFRVYAVTASIDTEGKETLTPTLLPPAPGAAGTGTSS